VDGQHVARPQGPPRAMSAARPPEGLGEVTR
jgi:hypothetical protein